MNFCGAMQFLPLCVRSGRLFKIGGWGGESFVTPPTGKSCFVFVFALRACVRARATRREISVVSRHVFVASSSALLLLLLRALRPDSVKLQ